MDNATVWIDLSDLQRWTGHLTGVQRVVYNVAMWYERHGTARYFILDAKTNQLVEVTTDSLGPATSGGPRRSFTVARSIRVFRHTLSRCDNVTPGWLPSSTSRFICHLARRRHRAVRRSVRAFTALTGLATPPRAASFAPGDIVLVLGRAWETPGLEEALWHLKRRTHVRVYHCVFDLTPVCTPHFFGAVLCDRYARYLAAAATVSDGLLAISRSTKHDLEVFCRERAIAIPPLHVIRLGDDMVASVRPTSPDVRLLGEEFVLSVGTLEARKNHSLLYAVWKLAAEREVELPRLVIVGRPGLWAGDVLHALAFDPSVSARVDVFSEVNDDQLLWLYQHCRYTVYPSIYEGWGLPIAESLCQGKLCLASRASAMQEVGGDLAVYFSPFDASECLKAMVHYLDDGRLRCRERRIEQEYVRHSWDCTAERVNAAVRGASGANDGE
jgi:glycosyltransferase involved in cell wall biosynthesis